MLLLKLSVVVPLGLLSHCVSHYLLSPQVLLFFQKEKEEEAASCKTQITPPPPPTLLLQHLDYIQDFCGIRIKLAKPFVESWVNFIMKRDGI